MSIRLTIITSFLLKIICLNKITNAIVLSGSPHSFSRFPKWAHTFESEMSFDFKTTQTGSLLLYTDDGCVNYNYFSISIVRGNLQLELRLGNNSVSNVEKRELHQVTFDHFFISDGRWHKFSYFQAWEKVKVQLDDVVQFVTLDQKSFSLGNLRTNSDMFVGGIPREYTELHKLSAPLKLYARHFAGSIRNLLYRLHPQGMSPAQSISSKDTRTSDNDFCTPATKYIATTKFSDTINQSSNSTTRSLPKGYCKNEGLCYSTNNGPACDCSFVNFDGKQCEKAQVPFEVTFFGNEWLGYDLILALSVASVENENGAKNEWNESLVPPILSQFEAFSISFKTEQSNSLLLLAGDTGGSEKRLIRAFNHAGGKSRFNDNLWHKIYLTRELNYMHKKHQFLMRLVVDEIKVDEIKQSWESKVNRISNRFLYVGGAPTETHLRLPIFKNFNGCLQNVLFETDIIHIDLLKMADKDFHKPHVQIFGDLSFSCSSKPTIISFNDGQAFVALPSWNSPINGNLEFQFRTLEPEGLLLYHGQNSRLSKGATSGADSDYIAFELVYGHLFFIINLGSGTIRLQATVKPVNDGIWHNLALERSGRTGFIVVDTLRTEYTSPGLSANLDTANVKIFIGAVPWPEVKKSAEISEQISERRNFTYNSRFIYPPTIWMASLKKGFIGCLKNLRINGINEKVATIFDENIRKKGSHSRNFSSISRCPSSLAKTKREFCRPNPCQNFGKCHSLHSRFKCDCSDSHFDGPTCSYLYPSVQLPMQPNASQISDDQIHKPGRPIFDGLFVQTFVPTIIYLSHTLESQSEDIELKFRATGVDPMVILDSRALPIVRNTENIGTIRHLGKKNLAEGRQAIALAVVNGELWLTIAFGSLQNQSFFHKWGKDLQDGQWHSAKINRRGSAINVFLDGIWDKRMSFFNDYSVYIDEISIGKALISQGTFIGEFVGEIRTLFFNKYDLLSGLRDNKKAAEKSRPFPIWPIKGRNRTLSASGQRPISNISAIRAASEMESAKKNSRKHNKARINDISFNTDENDAFFDQAPNDCLWDLESCEIEEDYSSDGYFTPAISRTIERANSPTANRKIWYPADAYQPIASPISPSSVPIATSSSVPSSSSPSPLFGAFSPSLRRGKTPGVRVPISAATKQPTKQAAGATASSPQTLVHLTKSTIPDKESSTKNTIANVPKLIPIEREILPSSGPLTKTTKMPYYNNDTFQSKFHTNQSLVGRFSNQYYEPPGGWPPRTRTWPDGRKIGQSIYTFFRGNVSSDSDQKKPLDVVVVPSNITRSHPLKQQKTMTVPLSQTTSPSVVHFTFVASRVKPTISSTHFIHHHHRATLTTAPLLDPSLLNAVRPTTPMSMELTTQKAVIQSSIYPKAMIIGIGFVCIISIIALCVCCAFKRRTCFGSKCFKKNNSKQQKPEIPGTGTYTVLPSSPPSQFVTPSFPRAQLNRAFAVEHHVIQNGRTSYCTKDSATLPPSTNLRNGYGAIYGSTADNRGTCIETDGSVVLGTIDKNGGPSAKMTRSVVSMRSSNSIAMNQIHTSPISPRSTTKKEFKEWYV